jgi:cation transport ATPase
VTNQIDDLLARPLRERLREHKYRCAQAMVFGVPVLGLQLFGTKLGGAESERWVAIFQALLAGWVCYVGAAGMLIEGLILLARRRVSGDFLVAVIAVGCFLWSACAATGALIVGHAFFHPLLFHIVVLVLIVWTGSQWFRFRKACAQEFSASRFSSAHLS